MNTPILNMLIKYAKSKSTRMHMPGHKGKMPHFGSISNIADYDITELNFTDNLLNPNGVILQAEQLFAQAYKANFAHFVVNGSSGGLLALLSGAEGNVLVDRNSHQATYNALQMFHDKYFLVDNDIIDGKVQPIRLEQIVAAVEGNPCIKTVLLTSPNYYGNSCDLKAIYSYLKSKNITFFVDSAHGAAYGLNPLLPQHAIVNCDACVMSTHKTLPAMTQTAVILANDEDLSIRIKRSLNRFTTTSPNYILLASIDYAREVGQNQAEKRLVVLYEAIAKLRMFCAENKIVLEPSADFSRIVIDGRSFNLSGKHLYAQLQQNGVTCEMYNLTSVVCILSYMDNMSTVKRLIKALRKVKVGSDILNVPTVLGTECVSVDNPVIKKTKWIKLSNSQGKILAHNVGVMPPCVPLGVKGEVITQELIDILTSNADICYNITGGKVEIAAD